MAGGGRHVRNCGLPMRCGSDSVERIDREIRIQLMTCTCFLSCCRSFSFSSLGEGAFFFSERGCKLRSDVGVSDMSTVSFDGAIGVSILSSSRTWFICNNLEKRQGSGYRLSLIGAPTYTISAYIIYNYSICHKLCGQSYEIACQMRFM